MDAGKLRLRFAWTAAFAGGAGIALLALATLLAFEPAPARLAPAEEGFERSQYLDRHGEPLNVTFANTWNVHDRVALHEVPALLQAAFIAAEDRRFHAHAGVDWRARFGAAMQNLRAGRTVRGASTISEQCIRMLRPRPRTLFSRWLEGFEAYALERRHGKDAILEFYLNQVPYAARRRGVVQAARYYFDRDLSTLNEREMLALAAIVRAPKWFDPREHPARLARAVTDLAAYLAAAGIANIDTAAIAAQALSPARVRPATNVDHFLAFLAHEHTPHAAPHAFIPTTLDLSLQRRLQAILEARLDDLAEQQVGNGAVLVVDHATNEILAWVVGATPTAAALSGAINAVTVRRQPGSTLKPLLYAQALADGWTAATLIDDAPLEEGVGVGLHAYHNYSGTHYGPIPLREALGNSLNIPAVRAVQFVGAERFLDLLRALGVESLAGHPNVYGDGLALGNGELTLYELVQAYTVLARMGERQPLAAFAGAAAAGPGERVLSEEVASLIADILSDPYAREKEFGRYSILNLPRQTAVKTGTSSDYRDAWAIGYDDRYTVGVWMGNLDYAPMTEVTGSGGPAYVLRAAFGVLNRGRDGAPLLRSPRLVRLSVCPATGAAPDASCTGRDEWFIDGRLPRATHASSPVPRLRKPTHGLALARDPRIPDEFERFEFAVTEQANILSVHWYVDDALAAVTGEPRYAWPLAGGPHTAYATLTIKGEPAPVRTATVRFTVQ